MTIIEETGKEPTCPVCGSPDYGDCGHLVADLDRSFCECQGGELYEKMAEFLNLVEGAFLSHLTENTLILENGSWMSFGKRQMKALTLMKNMSH